MNHQIRSLRSKSLIELENKVGNQKQPISFRSESEQKDKPKQDVEELKATNQPPFWTNKLFSVEK